MRQLTRLDYDLIRIVILQITSDPMASALRLSCHSEKGVHITKCAIVHYDLDSQGAAKGDVDRRECFKNANEGAQTGANASERKLT